MFFLSKYLLVRKYFVFKIEFDFLGSLIIVVFIWVGCLRKVVESYKGEVIEILFFNYYRKYLFCFY